MTSVCHYDNTVKLSQKRLSIEHLGAILSSPGTSFIKRSFGLEQNSELTFQTPTMLVQTMVTCVLTSALAMNIRGPGESLSIAVSEGETKSFRSDYRFGSHDFEAVYDITTDKDLDLEVTCLIDISCQGLGRALFEDSTRKTLLVECTSDSKKTVGPIRSRGRMYVTFNAAHGPESSYDCSVKGVSSRVTPPPPVPQTCECGQNSQNKIINGRAAEKGEVPWQVSLQVDRGSQSFSFGGGSLISGRFALTAAHCLYEQQLERISIFMGSNDLRKGGFRVAIGKATPHPQYDDMNKDNDIAVIELSPPVQFSVDVRPVCLPTPFRGQELTGRRAVVAGFGYTEYYGMSSSELLLTRVTIVSMDTCKAAHERQVTDNMLCASGDNTDSCQGDSGGPMTLASQAGINYIVGVVSWGQGCNNPRYPGVYTRVTNYIDWIAQVTDNTICVRND